MVGIGKVFELCGSIFIKLQKTKDDGMTKCYCIRNSTAYSKNCEYLLKNTNVISYPDAFLTLCKK